MMNVIYKDVIEKHAAQGTIIRIYMDDITIATSGTLQDHIDAVRDVLRVAEQHDLYFKLSKCTFHASSIDYLGVTVGWPYCPTWTMMGFALNVDDARRDLPCYNEASTTERCWDRGGCDAHKVDECTEQVQRSVLKCRD
jgi:hypothetical protein